MGRRNRHTSKPELPEAAAERPGAVRRLAETLSAFVEHPTTRLVVALILILSGFIETYDTLREDMSQLRVRVGHGIIILGFVNAFSSLPAVIDGIERWLKAAELRSERRQHATNSAAAQKRGKPGIRP
jgi:hypothetical protein